MASASNPLGVEPREIGSWVQEKLLGSGGFGTVTLWRNSETNHMLAVKKCRWGTDGLMTPKYKERWEKEVEIMGRLDHRNVVKALQVPPELETLRVELPLLCMEYCTKGDLRQVLNRPENCCGIKEVQFRVLVQDITNAVKYLHSMKIIHRDLKPENIVLQDVDGKVVYKLIDLGYAKELDQSSVCTSFVGTLQYLAPELFLSKKYSCTVDFWSLGLVAHECIVGVRPFLPNMPPAQWMQHVEKKSPSDICSYQTMNGNIIFSTKMFPENNITSVLKQLLESWLRVMLEWDPRKRGRVVNSDGTETIAFHMLEDVLERKIMRVFCVDTCQQLSYEIDELTELEAVQKMIAADTGIAVEDQELLLPRGSCPEAIKRAIQCWALPEVEDWKLYVFRKGSQTPPQISPKIPQPVEQMLQDPKAPVDYYHQRRMWATSVFLLQKEVELYQQLLQAQRVDMLNLLLKNAQLHKVNQRMQTGIHEVLAYHHFFRDSVQFDLEMYSQYASKEGASGPQRISQTWRRGLDVMTQKVSQLQEHVKQLESAASAQNGRVVELQRSPLAKLKQSEVYEKIFERAMKAYEELRRRPKEARQEKKDNEQMVKIVYHFLKERDKLLKDYYQHLGRLHQCKKELEELVPHLEQSLRSLEAMQGELRLVQQQRQVDVWQLVNVFNGPQAGPSFEPKTDAKNSSELPTSSNGPGLQSPLSLSFVLAKSAEESKSIMHENMVLRYQLQDLMSAAIHRNREMFSDQPSHQSWGYRSVADPKNQ